MVDSRITNIFECRNDLESINALEESVKDVHQGNVFLQKLFIICVCPKDEDDLRKTTTIGTSVIT